jgi:hypothetical protein
MNSGSIAINDSPLGELTIGDIAVAAAVNDREILANCLERSPDIKTGTLRLRTYTGFASASLAYNQAIEDAGDCRVLVFAHQDVYLPRGWADLVVRRLRELTAADPDWAVAGVVGLVRAGGLAGRVWTSGRAMVVSGEVALPASVVSLDELLLILRLDSGLRFDSELPGFHLYGTDIVHIAAAESFSSYAIDAPVVHHDKIIPWLDAPYKKAWRYMRRKWFSRLPIPTLIAAVTKSPFTLPYVDLQIRWWRRGINSREVPQGDPADIARAAGFE